MFANVALPVPDMEPLCYSVPKELEKDVCLGSAVSVKLGRRKRLLTGFVVSVSDTPQEENLDPSKIKNIEELAFREPLFDEKRLRFLKWISEYYFFSLGEVIKTALPKQYFEEKKRKRKTDFDLTSFSLKRDTKNITLNPHQTAAVSKINEKIGDGAPHTFLLQGVTGSGKTEVYFEAIDKTVKAGMGAIILVPEIVLTPQFIGRYMERFGDSIAVLHSALTRAQARQQWQKIRAGKAMVVVGARSAIFAPLQKTGLIIVDEEHETAFKQDNLLRYNARDLAVVVGKFNQAVVVLGSATPSMETLYNAKTGKYSHLLLPERIKKVTLPEVTIIDMKAEKRAAPMISNQLYYGILETLDRGEQVLLFLNRRGFSHFIICNECGFVYKCPNCSVTLTYYESRKSMMCHYCGYREGAPTQCCACHGMGVRGVGTGTEQLEMSLKELIPQARISRLDRDAATSQEDVKTILDDLQNRKTDILVGTQMVAKGHDFPGITLVGVILADTIFNLPDFRSAERSFQLLTQVAGRAGRDSSAGKVLIQTYHPGHYSVTSAKKHDMDTFSELELSIRKEFDYPPFWKMCVIKVNGMNLARVISHSEKISTDLNTIITRTESYKNNIELLGPAPAPLSRLKGMYRYQLFIKGKSSTVLNSFVKTFVKHANPTVYGIKIGIDMDPVSTL